MAITPPPGYVLDQSADSGPTPPPGYVLDKPAEDISMPESFGRGALNNFPMAQQATAALTPGNYSPNLANLNQKAAAAKAANPISYGAGAVAGAAAPLAIPGVGEALESAPIAGNALLGASNAIGNTDLAQNPKEALKQGLQGAVVGGAVGKAGEMAADALKPVAEGLESYANKKGVQALNLRPGTLGISDQELEDLGKFAHENGLVQGPTQVRKQNADALLNQTGKQIQAIGGGAQTLQNPTPFTDKLQQDLQNSAKIYGAEANPEATIYRQGIANLQQNGTTFDQLQQLKNAYGARAFDANGGVKNEAAADVYGQIKDAMKAIIKSSPEEYQDAMDKYSKLLDIHSGLTKQLQSEQAGGVQAKGYGMAGKMVGLLGQNPAINVGAAAALAPISPFASVGALTPILTNPQAMSQTARGLAGAIPRASQFTTQELNDYLTSKYGNH